MNKFKSTQKKAAAHENPAKLDVSRGRFRDAVLTRFLRGRLAAQLREEHGLGFFESRSLADEVDDDVFDDCCTKVGLTAAPKAGGIIDRILNIDPAKIRKIIDLIMFVMGLFKGTAEEGTARAVAAAAPEPEPQAEPTTAEGGTTEPETK